MIRLFCDRILVCLSALLFLQFPLFVHEYQVQLTGRVAELQWQVDEMRQNAGSKPMNDYITKFVSHKDGEIAAQGKVMEKVYLRWLKFSRALAALKEATLWTRPWAFGRFLDGDVLKSTLHSFVPGIPMSFEGMLYALIGIFAGALLSPLAWRRN